MTSHVRQSKVEKGPRWLVNTVRKLGYEQALSLALPGADLYRDDRCHVHQVHFSIFAVNSHEGSVYAAMRDIFDWHNLRTTTLPDEGFFRCLAIYGAAAQAVLETRENHPKAKP